MADITQQGLYQEGNSIFDDIFALGDIEVQNSMSLELSLLKHFQV